MSADPITVTLGKWTFDHFDYDREADVLYLSIGEPRPALGVESPEGHVWLMDIETDEICGLTIVGGDALIKKYGKFEISVPETAVSVGNEDFGGLLVGAGC